MAAMDSGKKRAGKTKRVTKWGFGAYSLLVLALVLFILADGFAEEGSVSLALLAFGAAMATILGYGSLRHYCRRNGLLFIENARWKDQ
jgi:hypothetical protein